ncbi:MAG: DNA polymerase III subunit alpha [Acidobacteriota bacterium]
MSTADSSTVPPFVHLHLHSQYSLLDGANRPKDLVERVKALDMGAVAVTDHGNLFGAIDFYKTARAHDVQPILGIEGYVAPDVDGRVSNRRDRTHTGVADGGFHLVLLAETLTGWQHLLKLSSDSYQNGFYYKPRMDKSTLADWNEGLIAINGHLGSSIAYHLTQFHRTSEPRHWQNALDEARWHAATFGPNADGEPRFYVELQRHIEEQEVINPLLVRLARELDLPLVCDNDAHFLREEDWDNHDTLVCISTGKIKEEPSRMRYPRDLYVKSPAEMAELFLDYQGDAGAEALANTQRIAARCNVELDLSENHAPVVKIVHHDRDAALAALEEGSTPWFEMFCSQYELRPFDATREAQLDPEKLKAECDTALRALAEAGQIWRYGRDGITDEKKARLERELKILADKDISSYFLIVWDFCNEARRRGIPIGARGSGVGTMVGFCIGLSHACPVHYGLLFERFTDPDRSEYPDIDIDMCQDGRADILQYVRDKYDADGSGKVAQIITFNVLKAKAAIRDVGRVLNMPLAEVDKVCKLVPEQLNITLAESLDKSPDLRQRYHSDPDTKRWLDAAQSLEGMTRHAGVHAAGVVIGSRPLSDVVPLATSKQGDREILVTQWDGPTCEDVGLLKMDFLGLRTLSVIERARVLARETLDAATIRRTIDPDGARPENWDPLDLDRLTFGDARVFERFKQADTVSVFQFESDGMRNLLRAMQPDRLEDLIAANALYRPGPMSLIPDYNDRKHGRKDVPSVHPIVDKHTAETYGIMVYQEQVMQIVHELGDIPLRAAYSLIKAISKKKEKTINAQRAQFLKGAKDKGLSKREAQNLFDLILKFAGYGFNKSHSAAYAIVAYQTAYLKTYFPVQYMAAVLTYESENTEKLVKYIDACRRIHVPGRAEPGVDVRPPDINTSATDFTVVFDDDEPRDAQHGHVRFGLAAVKGVGGRAVEAIIEQRNAEGPFASLYDFCERVPMSLVNRSTLEALIKCGAFDHVHGTAARSALIAALDGAIQSGQRAAADRASGQTNLFGMLGGGDAAGDASAEPPPARLPDVQPWEPTEQLRHEKSVLGFYVSSHPLETHAELVRCFSTARADQLRRLPHDSEVIVGGLLTGVRKRITQRGRSAGQTMAILSFEDRTGPVDAVVFAESYANCASVLEEDKVLFLKGRVQHRDERVSLVVSGAIPLERCTALAEGVCVRLPSVAPALDGDATEAMRAQLEQLRNALLDAGGSDGVPVTLEMNGHGRPAVRARLRHRVRLTPDLPARLAAVLGVDDCCEWIGPRSVA